MKSTVTHQSLAVTIVIFTVLIVVFRLRYMYFPLSVETAITETAPLGYLINKWTMPHPFLSEGLTLLSVYLSMLVLTRIIVRNMVFPARTHIYIILYTVASYGLFIGAQGLPVAITAYLLLKAAESFTTGFRRSAAFGPTFRGAFLLGLATLFHAPSVVYVLLLPVALWCFMRSGREALTAIVGLLLPAATYAYIMWACGEAFLTPFTTLFADLMTPAGFPPPDFGPVGILRLSAAGLLAVTVLLSLFAFAAHSATMRTRALRIYIFFVFFLLIAAGSLFLPCASISQLPLIALPVSVVATEFYSRHTGAVPSVLYLLTIFAALGANIAQMV